MRQLVCVAFVAFAISASSQIVINEICATNGDVVIEPETGNFPSWLELYNPTNAAVDVSWFMLSDDLALPGKWLIPGSTVIPAKGHLLIWCDGRWSGYHAGFSLDPDGESIILSTNTGTLLDRVDFPKQYTNNSYGRVSDGAGTWKHTSKPTPNANNSNQLNDVPMTQPVFSKGSGRYDGSVTIALSHPKNGVDIRYTTNGAEPSASSLKYNSPIKLQTTKVLKAKAFHPDFLASETASATYLLDEHTSTLPVVSISTNPKFLWDNTIGIYTDGTNGISGNCNGNNMNWNQAWDRHAVFEYLSPSGESLINQHADIRIGGACSRNNPQKSFVIQAKKKYGDGDFDYAFFPTKKKVDKFGQLFLRNAGNDFNTTMFRDAFLQSLGIGQMDLDYMAYQPAVFYLNGQYWGIQNLREKIDGDYIEANYGIDKDDVDLLETWENAIVGDNAAWVNYKTTLATLNPTDPTTFDFIDSHIDVQEYINYLVTEIYVANTDWPGNNVKFWRQRSTNGKFRWILWDTDFGFGLYEGASYPTHPTLNFATEVNGPGWPNPAWSTEHIRLVLQNPEFKNRFIATLSTAMRATFHPDRINEKIEEFRARIQAEVPYHKERWGGTIYDWNYETTRMSNFATQRYTFMQSHVANFFGIAPLNFTVNTLPGASGKVLMNGVVTEPFENAPYYSGVPYRVKAMPDAGFRFTGWSVTTTANQLINLVDNGAEWKYFDLGSLPSALWTSTGFNDAGWAQGNAQLGYGDGDEATTVNFGSDINNKYITTYFRKAFSITNLSNLTDINASILFDDGVVVYLNGFEVYRNNMPEGPIDNSTLALSAMPENSPTSFTISKSLLTSGVNTFSVEVHQVSGGSSDISFDFNASLTRSGGSTTYNVSNDEVYDTAYADVTMVANFEPLESIEGLVLNEVSTAPSFAKDNASEAEDWIELYNAGSSPINISGLMLTDDLTQKDKHVLNRAVPWLLQPGAYQIFWADGQPEQGDDHLSFKLSAEGESIGIYQAAGFDTTVVAELDFGFVSAGFSWARLPNITGPFLLTNALTPGEANAEVEIVWMFPNPASQIVNVIIRDENTTVSIFDSMGRKASSQIFDDPQVAALDISHLSNGIYMLKLKSGNKELKSRLIVTNK
jgi:CotH kinase protein/Chitobiase/beta-hexosaminidase C-terminal domain/Secretion system C-terminal sorting domain/Lamin Tail Domain/Divergent InlB B-repeat domain